MNVSAAYEDAKRSGGGPGRGIQIHNEGDEPASTCGAGSEHARAGLLFSRTAKQPVQRFETAAEGKSNPAISVAGIAAVSEAVGVGVAEGVGVRVRVGVGVDEAVGVCEAVTVAVSVAVGGGVRVGVTVEVAVGVAVGLRLPNNEPSLLLK